MSERFVADTCVLIAFSNGEDDAIRTMSGAFSRGAVFAHSVGILEMLEGARNRKHLSEMLLFLSTLRRVHAKSVDHEVAVQFMVDYRLSHNVDWPDCLIAATSIRLDMPVATTNDKHFRQFPGLRVVRPY